MKKASFKKLFSFRHILRHFLQFLINHIKILQKSNLTYLRCVLTNFNICMVQTLFHLLQKTVPRSIKYFSRFSISILLLIHHFHKHMHIHFQIQDSQLLDNSLLRKISVSLFEINIFYIFLKVSLLLNICLCVFMKFNIFLFLYIHNFNYFENL